MIEKNVILDSDIRNPSKFGGSNINQKVVQIITTANPNIVKHDLGRVPQGYRITKMSVAGTLTDNWITAPPGAHYASFNASAAGITVQIEFF